MTEDKVEAEPTLVEKWIKDQQDWQRTWTEYFDSMVKNDDFLVHLGNAMRGSLLAGKPYPGTEPVEAEVEDPAAPADDRIDEVLHALNRLQGDVADLKMTVEDLDTRLEQLSRLKSVAAAPPPAPARPPPPDSPPPNPVPGEVERGKD
jgi:hypothetical protein